jgi:hypothetical protein
MEPSQEIVPLKSLLVFPVMVSVANYCSLSFLGIAFSALFPLFCATPIEFGGLDLPPNKIGLWLGGMGCLNGVFQALFLSRIVRRWGPGRVFRMGMAAHIPMFALFPVTSAVAKHSRVSTAVWVLIAVQLCFGIIGGTSYGELTALL